MSLNYLDFGSVASWVTAMATMLAATAFLANQVRGQRARRVEQEIIGTLGIEQVPTSAAADAPATNTEAPHTDERNQSDKNGDSQPGQNHQNIFVNIRGSESSEALAQIVRQQSDGHARLVVKYYAQGHQQAFVTFVASIFFAITGFGVVLWAAFILLSNPSQPEPPAIAAAIGIVNQAISYLFFRRADSARGLMMQLIDKLRLDREQEMHFIAAIVAADAIDNVALRDALRSAMVLQFTGATISPDQLDLLTKTGTRDFRSAIPPITINPPPSSTVPFSDTSANVNREKPS